MWDLVAITAGDDDQAEEFRVQLEQMNLNMYTQTVGVFTDPPDEGKLGSGGCMIAVADELCRVYPNLKEMKVLVVHSGGFSQRMSYQSLYGKCFTHLPGNITVLEKKLQTYQVLSQKMSPGIVVSAADVIEDTTAIKNLNIPAGEMDMILFATECDPMTATGHGVFCMNHSTNQLKFVLQKPSLEEIEHYGKLPNGDVLTDCFYWMDWGLVDSLARLKGIRPILYEICCYGDFMRPLGTNPCRRYCQIGPESQQRWRQDLFDLFSKARHTVFNLGKDTFFHLGTHAELVNHICFAGTFYNKFLKGHVSQHLIHSRVRHAESNCLVEFCDAPKLSMNNGVIASGLVSKKKIDIPDGMMIFTVALEMNRYVTCAVPLGQDVKIKEEVLMWCGIECGQDISLWEAPIFPVAGSREESLDALLYQMTYKELDRPYELLSLDRVIFEEANMEENMRFREEMKRKYK